MRLPPERPFALAVAFKLVQAASLLVPGAGRDGFQREWQHKLLHRWQFLFHTGLWNAREAAGLLANSAKSIVEAVQHFGAQEAVRTRVVRFVQSPVTCLSALAAILMTVAFCSGGLPATRDLLFKQIDAGGSRRVYVWVHNIRGGGDKPLPSEVVRAWETHSSSIDSAAAFRAVHREVEAGGSRGRRLVVTTEPSFFRVMGGKPAAGSIPDNSDGVMLSYDAWTQYFHAAPRAIGRTVAIAGQQYPVTGILPEGFRPLSRQTAIYLVHPRYGAEDAYAVLRVKSGISDKRLNHDLTEVAQNVTYYFLHGQLRYGFAAAELWTPVRSFGVALVAALLMLIMVYRVKWRSLIPKSRQDKAYFRQAGFFAAKMGLALLCVFTACLEWSRSSSAILFGNFDPASGPFLLWLFILGTMGIFFWAAVDQRSRCRECLELLAFPVRMGSPGSMLLDWSGIELCCTQGHGVLHVPHLVSSWSETDQWIELDDSWQALFGRERRG